MADWWYMLLEGTVWMSCLLYTSDAADEEDSVDHLYGHLMYILTFMSSCKCVLVKEINSNLFHIVLFICCCQMYGF